MKSTAYSVLTVLLLSQSTQAANMPRGPVPPGPPATFQRSIRYLPLHKKFCDSKTEIDEYEHKPMGSAKVICRQQCPEGYGITADQCIWQENFKPHVRWLKLAGGGDQCYDDEVKTLRYDGGARRACESQCPTAFGWCTDNDGWCKFKQVYTRSITNTLNCGDGWELLEIGARAGVNCAKVCPAGYQPKPTDKSKCQWVGDKPGQGKKAKP